MHGEATRLIGSGSQNRQTRGTNFRQSEAVEMNLDLAEQLWQARRKGCTQTAAGPEDPLDPVLAKVAQ